MFDERHLQLSSSYTRASEHFIKTVIYPLAGFVWESIEQEIDNEFKIEIGQATYVMTPDENGGWKWSNLEEENPDCISAEFEQIEELLQELLTPLLKSGDATPLLPSSNTPPDLPPIVSPSDKPPFLPPSATPVEEIVIQTEESNNSSEENINNNSIFQNIADLSHSTETVEEIVIQTEEPNNSSEENINNNLIFQNIADLSNSTETSNFLSYSTTLEPLNSIIRENYIEATHWQELVEGSAIAPAIAELNFESLQIDSIEQQHQAWEYLMYSDKLERLNTGRLSGGMLHKYSHIEHGGWWCNSGVDPRCFENLQPGEKPDKKLWGCYKPNQPRERVDKPGKLIKYEHPPKTDLSIFLLDVPDEIANKIYDKAGVNPTQSDRSSGFWYCVWKHNVPITITEGAKKAASLLSQGHAAIGLPGIYAGYRSKDELGNPMPPSLHDELAVFATPERKIKICFDHETRFTTKRNINIATYRTGQLLEEKGASVSVVQLPGPEKGVDDLIVAHGVKAFEQLFQEAVPLEEWYQNNQPPDLCFSIILKDGTVKTIYQQKRDGSVSVTPENLEEETHTTFKKPRSQVVKQDISDITPSSQVIEAEVIEAEVRPKKPIPSLDAVEVKPILSWSRRENVTLYKPTFLRKRLEARENKEIAFAAYSLVKKYGVQQKNMTGNQDKNNGLVYQADAFTIKKVNEQYTIYRRGDEKNALLKFHANQWGKITITEKPKDMLPIERQEFLLVADYLKSGKPLPSVDEDPRKIASNLGSLSVDGTHNLLESFKQAEVLKILTHTLKAFGREDLTLGNYRILYQKSPQDSKSVLRLLKTEHNGVTREAVCFELNRTDEGMTHQVKTMAITELELNKLRLLAQKLDIDKYVATMESNPHATRDLELPVHPQIAKQWQNLENRSQSQSSQPKPVKTSSQISKQHRPTNPNNREEIPLPLHPQLAQYWQQLEQDNSWADIAKHGHTELQQKIQQTGKLTISEQRELYQKIQIQAWHEMQQYERTDIELPRLVEIVKDLRQQLSQQPLSPNQTEFSNSIDNMPVPLHPEIAQQWQDLETNHAWSSVADQWNHPLREKLQQTGKLTIGEQRELYQKILLQSQVDQHHHGKTDISLPPLSEIIQDLIDERRKAIENTYTPQVNVRQQHQHGKFHPNQMEM